jgi:pimeloyl-ACP methyl ester carboxylesterase
MYFTQFFSIFLALCWLAPAAMAIDEKDCGPATYAQLNSGRLNLSKTLDAIKSEKDFPYHQAPGNWFHLPAGSKTSAIHYLLQPSGSKKPRGTLVLIGGLNFHSERWNHSGLISELNRLGFDIVSVDIPGHGWTFLHELQ